MVGSAGAYAKYRAVSRATVSKAIKVGRLSESVGKVGNRYLIDFELADKEWEEYSTKNCVVCGTLFKSTHGASKVCSEACRQTRVESYNPRKDEETRECDECGSLFSTSRSLQRFCGRACYIKNKNRELKKKQREKNRIERERGDRLKECVVCGERFNPTSSDITCSKRCQLEHYRHVKKEKNTRRQVTRWNNHERWIRVDNCIFCGRPFFDNKNIVKKVYCSKKCQRKHEKVAMPDSYINYLISSGTTLKGVEIPKSLTETYRLLLLIKRELRDG